MEQKELTNVLKDVDDKERSDQVVDALHVAAGWMADGPDEQDPFKYLQKDQTQGFGLEPDYTKFVKHNNVNLTSSGAKVFFPENKFLLLKVRLIENAGLKHNWGIYEERRVESRGISVLPRQKGGRQQIPNLAWRSGTYWF